MLETLRRVGDLQGVPRTTQRTSDEFFDASSSARAADLPVLVGELYFEYHRGTYTTQAAVKRGEPPRASACCTTPSCSPRSPHWRGRREYPPPRSTAVETLCLNQFHDIIPGSSISEVYEDAQRDYAEIERAARRCATRRSRRSATARPTRGR